MNKTLSRSTVSQLLLAWNKGDQDALNKLSPLIYDELHRLADYYMRRERSDHTLQATALVHEAYLRLIDLRQVSWQNRAHFLGIAAKLMREILVDYARKHNALKRGGAGVRLTLDEAIELPDKREMDLLALGEALISVKNVNPQWGRIVELRFFGGLSNDEIAEVLGVSIPTVVRQWRTARAWLYREVSKKETRDD